MVAYASQQANLLRPMDTGAIFDGRVRIWVLTDDPQEADACGAKFHELGLPRELVLRLRPLTRPLPAINTEVSMPEAVRKKLGVPAGAKAHPPLRWRGRVLLLETDRESDLERFYKFLHSKNPNVPKADKPKSLSQLADEGVIETIE